MRRGKDAAPGDYSLLLKLRLAYKALRTPVALGAQVLLEDAKGRVLLVRHSYLPGWHFPGGGVDHGEPPAAAAIREAQEEVGLVRSGPPALLGIYVRKGGWATSVIAFYRLPDAEIAFRPNFEIREIVYAEPRNPPAGTSAAARRRLQELTGQAPQSPYW